MAEALLFAGHGFGFFEHLLSRRGLYPIKK
jgi:hypothetical protein